MNYSQLQTLNSPNNNWIVALIGSSNIGPNWNWLFPIRNEVYFSFAPDKNEVVKDQVSNTPAFYVNVIQQAAIKSALKYIEGLTGIRFVETISATADLYFANADISDPRYSAFTVSHATSNVINNSQEITNLSLKQFIYLDNVEFAKENLNPIPGSNGYETLLHELGHTLGLKHPSENSPNLSLFEDTTYFTLMSYTHFGIKDSFSPFDIAALKYLYGEDGIGGKFGYLENNRMIWGTDRAELIFGSDTNDLCKGLGGNDRIEGGNGFDTAAWDSPSNNFTLEMSGNQVIVTDKNGLDGIDTLISIEKLQFTDRAVIIESQSHGSYADLPTELYQFFITAFNAAPGVTYMDQLAEAYRYGLSVKQIVDIFTTKKQFTDVYSPSLSHSELATQLVNNIVKNSASASAKTEAIADIKGALDIGWTVGDVIYTVFGNLAHKDLSDPNWGNTAKQFNNEIAVAKYYTEVLNQSTTDLETLKDVIQPVTQSTDVSTDSVLAQLIGVTLMSGGTFS